MGKPYVIGLTGPTGSGKSTVAQALQRLGCAIVDADAAARSVAEQPACLAKLKEAFGADITGPDGALDRKTLSKRAFAGPEATRRLNSITHPAIFEACIRQIREAQQAGCKAVILDAPLLFESGAERLCDAVIAVTAAPESRLRRIMARDNIGEDLARARMEAQHGEEYYTQRAGYAFSGSTDWSVLDKKAGELLERILEDLDQKT